LKSAIFTLANEGAPPCDPFQGASKGISSGAAADKSVMAANDVVAAAAAEASRKVRLCMSIIPQT
jgi:hypothetical protein